SNSPVAPGAPDLPDQCAALVAAPPFLAVPAARYGVATVCRRDGILQQHRDRQRTDTAWHGRQCAGDVSHLRVHVAYDARAALLERLETFGAGEQPLDGRAIGHLRRAHVDDAGARLDEIARQKSGPPNR